MSGIDVMSPPCWALAASVVHLSPANSTYQNAAHWPVIHRVTTFCAFSRTGHVRWPPLWFLNVKQSNQSHYFEWCIKYLSWTNTFHLTGAVRGQHTISPYNKSGCRMMCPRLELEKALTFKCFNFHSQTSSMYRSTKTCYESGAVAT